MENLQENQSAEKSKFLTEFKRVVDNMISTNTSSRNNNDYWRESYRCCHPKTLKEVVDILKQNDLKSLIDLSREYYQTNGYYRQILHYYAFLLKYCGILIPSPIGNNKLSDEAVQVKYKKAMALVESIQIPDFARHCALQALINGVYYGVIIQSKDKKHISYLDLPIEYCKTQFKDVNGNDIIQFDMNYFDSKKSPSYADLIKSYPEPFMAAYRKYLKNPEKNRWFFVPTEIGICIPFVDKRPNFVNLIPRILQYDTQLDLSNDQLDSAINRLIVQQIPHLNDGTLLFEPDEAEQIHKGSVEMLKGEKHLKVLTSYADVNSIASESHEQSMKELLDRIEQNIYSQAGVSEELFSGKTSIGLQLSQEKDIALMMSFAEKFARFVTNLVNSIHGKNQVSFKYMFLPVSYGNEADYISSNFKLSTSGYSYLIPAIAGGLSQNDLVGLKELENSVLKLENVLKPLQTAYTQSAESQKEKKTSEETGDNGDKDIEGGRPKAKESDKKDITIQKQESKNQNGGS